MRPQDLKVEHGLLHGADDGGHGIGQDYGRRAVKAVDPVHEDPTALQSTLENFCKFSGKKLFSQHFVFFVNYKWT
jgi:hypothetical protein